MGKMGPYWGGPRAAKRRHVPVRLTTASSSLPSASRRQPSSCIAVALIASVSRLWAQEGAGV